MRKSVFLKIFLFVLAVEVFYTVVGQTVPQTVSHPPEEIEIGSKPLTEAELVNLGKRITEGKGACLVCHSIQPDPQARCPAWEGVGQRATARVPGKSDEEYLRESLIEPGAYLVEGYPAIMPPAQKPPVSLTEAELTAVVAYLQSLGGKVTVQLAPGEVVQEETEEMASTPFERGKQVFERTGCLVCHMVKGVGGATGPDLSDIGTRRDEAYIRESIVSPNAFVVEGFLPNLMPQDFAEKFSPEELNDLVFYLINIGREASFKEEELIWTDAAKGRLGRIPFFARSFAKRAVERYARQKGLRVITPEIMETTRKNRDAPPFLGG